MKKSLVLMSAAVIALLTSCAKEEVTAPELGTVSGGVTFAATLEMPTKTTLDTENGSVSWTVGDAVKFYYEIGGENVEPVVSEALTQENIEDDIAIFESAVPEIFKMTTSKYGATLPEGASTLRHLYAASPASVVAEYVYPAYYVTVPQVQDGEFENASIALAKWNENKPAELLNFMNLCALLQFTVDETMTDVSQIRFTAANRSLVGKANIGFSTQLPYTPYVKNMVTGEESSTVIVNVDGPGTYYAAIIPGVLNTICLAYFDKDGNSLGEQHSEVEINAERANIYRIGANVETGNFPGEGGYFVKTESCGTKDGSSWDNAADYASVMSILSTATENKIIYMAGGEYIVSGVANVSAAHKNLTIYGGYPSTAKGCSLDGRDLISNPTVLKAGAVGHRIWNFANGTYYIDGITMTGCEVSNVGAAFSIKKTAVVHCKNCVFSNNNSKKYGGAVGFEALTSTETKFVNCQFISNTATSTALGGAVSSNTAGATLGTVSFENCLFDQNTSEAGVGAVCAEYVNYRFSDCIFRDNTDKNYVSDAIYMKSNNGVSVYCDACNFYYTDSKYLGVESDETTSGSIIKNNSSGKLAINNSLVTGPWGYKTPQLVTGLDGALTIIVNSTFFSQTGYPAVLANKGETHVLNSIVLNAATVDKIPGTGRGLATNGKSVVANSILTKVDEGGKVVSETTEKTTYSNNLIVVSNKQETFPVNTTWYGPSDHAGVMWSNKNASTTNVGDCRGKYYYYAWDGAYPAGADFTNATLEEVTGLVQAADAGFVEWLGDRLGKDIRGVQRDAASMWPGSYQN